MKKHFSKYTCLFILLVALFFINGCYYDNEQFLYPNAAVCDTSGTTYSKTIQPILQDQCYTCHSGTTPVGGFALTDYGSVKEYVNNGQLKGSITETGGLPIMPQSGKMSDCNINKIIAWINTGAPNN